MGQAGSPSTLGGGFSDPWGIAVDGSGNIFIADTTNYAVKEIPPGCVASSCVKTLISGQANNFQPRGIALDGSGNVFAPMLAMVRWKRFLSVAWPSVASRDWAAALVAMAHRKRCGGGRETSFHRFWRQGSA